MINYFNILPENVKKEIKDNYFSATMFNYIFKGWNVEKKYNQSNTIGEIYALGRTCVGYKLKYSQEQLETLYNYIKLVVKIQDNDKKKKDIVAMCDGKVSIEQLQEMFPNWIFEPYYKNYGYTHQVHVGYTIKLTIDSKYGAYLKKDDYYNPSDVKNIIKEYIKIQKEKLNDWYNTRLNNWNDLLNKLESNDE